MDLYSELHAANWSEHTFIPSKEVPEHVFSSYSSPDLITVDWDVNLGGVQLSKLSADVSDEGHMELPLMNLQSRNGPSEEVVVDLSESMDFACMPDCIDYISVEDKFSHDGFLMKSQIMPSSSSDPADPRWNRCCGSLAQDFIQEDNNTAWDVDQLHHVSEEVDLLNEEYNCIFAELDNLLNENSDCRMVVDCVAHHPNTNDRALIDREATESLSISIGTFDSNLLDTAEADERAKYEEDAVSKPPPSASTTGTVELIFPWNIEDESDRVGLSIVHLLRAYAEAVDEKASDVAGIVFRRLRGMVSPVAATNMQRLAYYFLQSLVSCSDNNNDYWAEELTELKEKCRENELEAFRAVYEILPCARIAHFTANQSILDCLKSQERGGDDVKIHIVDFDITEGLQWPPLMESLRRISGTTAVELRITAIEWTDDHDSINFSNYNNNQWRCSIEDTERRLWEYANSLQIQFSFQHAEIQNLESRIEVREDETLVANCMVGLPHMTWQRRKCEIRQFLRAARNLQPSIVTFACGGDQLIVRDGDDFVTRFDRSLQHFSATFDSLQSALPRSPSARTLIECLFFAPKIFHSIRSTDNNDDGGTNNNNNGISMHHLPYSCGFSGVGMSDENVRQAKDLLLLSNQQQEQCEGYTVQRQPDKFSNNFLLKWGANPLLLASTWR